MATTSRLPDINTVSLWAPVTRWLVGGWRDLWAAWGPNLACGLLVAACCAGVAGALILTNLAYWAFILTCGFVFVAPVLAMGPYETGRRLQAGERPTFASTFFVPQAYRQDLAYLGLALLIIFFIWSEVAQIVYGLSTFQIHRTVDAFLEFAVNSPDGRQMVLFGSLIGGAIAFLTYSLVVVSAPMLLDGHNVFEATATSVRAVSRNFAPMALWAFILAALTLGSAATGFAALVIVFPWLGLASWRAYRDLVAWSPRAAQAFGKDGSVTPFPAGRPAAPSVRDGGP
jgi:uncharacterized membrane protein